MTRRLCRSRVETSGRPGVCVDSMKVVEQPRLLCKSQEEKPTLLGPLTWMSMIRNN